MGASLITLYLSIYILIYFIFIFYSLIALFYLIFMSYLSVNDIVCCMVYRVTEV